MGGGKIAAKAYFTYEVFTRGGSWPNGEQQEIAVYPCKEEDDDEGQIEALTRAAEEVRNDPDCMCEVVFAGQGNVTAVMSGDISTASGSWKVIKWTNVTGTSWGFGLRCLVYNEDGSCADFGKNAKGFTRTVSASAAQ